MKAGDVILTFITQADGKVKERPALLLKQMPGYHGDWLACGISTQLHQQIKGFDELLDNNHPEYNSSGLIAPSIVRLGFLTTIASKNIRGSIGKLSTPVVKRLVKNLSDYLIK